MESTETSAREKLVYRVATLLHGLKLIYMTGSPPVKEIADVLGRLSFDLAQEDLHLTEGEIRLAIDKRLEEAQRFEQRLNEKMEQKPSSTLESLKSAMEEVVEEIEQEEQGKKSADHFDPPQDFNPEAEQDDNADAD